MQIRGVSLEMILIWRLSGAAFFASFPPALQ
jgi:hypothetical protein